MPRFLNIIFILTVLLFTESNAVAQQDKSANDSMYSVIYFGATSCYYCNLEKNIANIKKMSGSIKARYKDLHLKTLIISMDPDLQEGLTYIKKYQDSTWDEIAVGSFYNNELALFYLNKSKVPGVPHVLVIKHVTKKGEYNIPHSIKDDVLVDLVGGDQIDKWISENYYFPK